MSSRPIKQQNKKCNLVRPEFEIITRKTIIFDDHNQTYFS